jgi:hypothetical protein
MSLNSLEHFLSYNTLEMAGWGYMAPTQEISRWKSTVDSVHSLDIPVGSSNIFGASLATSH